MGAADLASAATALEQRFRLELERQQNRATVTLDLLMKKSRVGKNDAWDVSVGTAVGTAYDDGEDVSTYNDDTYVPAVLQWSEYGDAFAVTGRLEDAAQGDATELAAMWATKLFDSTTRAAAKINSDLWVGAGTTAPQILHGLGAASGPLDSTGTYAALARGTYAQWAGNVFSNSGVPRAFNMDLIEGAETDTYTASGAVPDCYITTPKIWRKMAAILAPNRRYMQEATIRGQKVILDGGFQAVEFNGKPIFRDKDVPAGYFAGLRLNEMSVDYLPTAPSRIARGDVSGMIPLAGLPAEIGTNPPTGAQALMAAVLRIARSGNKTKLQVLSTIALSATHPNRSFLVKDISET